MANKLAVAGPGSKYQVPGAAPAVFWAGLWHGMISPITFLVSLFNARVRIYETHNRGRLYDFGFIVRASAVLGGGGSRPGGTLEFRPARMFLMKIEHTFAELQDTCWITHRFDMKRFCRAIAREFRGGKTLEGRMWLFSPLFLSVGVVQDQDCDFPSGIVFVQYVRDAYPLQLLTICLVAYGNSRNQRRGVAQRFCVPQAKLTAAETPGSKIVYCGRKSSCQDGMRGRRDDSWPDEQARFVKVRQERVNIQGVESGVVVGEDLNGGWLCGHNVG